MDRSLSVARASLSSSIGLGCRAQKLKVGYGLRWCSTEAPSTATSLKTLFRCRFLSFPSQSRTCFIDIQTCIREVFMSCPPNLNATFFNMWRGWIELAAPHQTDPTLPRGGWLLLSSTWTKGGDGWSKLSTSSQVSESAGLAPATQELPHHEGHRWSQGKVRRFSTSWRDLIVDGKMPKRTPKRASSLVLSLVVSVVYKDPYLKVILGGCAIEPLKPLCCVCMFARWGQPARKLRSCPFLPCL